ncbi:chorismate-binding protein [Roseateles amylovorans]|uniref:Chorismate-binding protein n=1 Tax=Roseateles amylovorans TaxID=2978473 RepID=A0ABY6AZ74_9BURK|nr:chorismate-binding protein [Roseateles amylovorans]UXH76385.1 chorismate-binding protein [Roseateles amylovorans]
MTTVRRPSLLWAAFDFPRHPLAREDGERLRGAYFVAPDRRLVARDATSLREVLRQAHDAAREGAWVLGGLRYEAAAALDASLPSRPQTSGEPLAEFAVWRDAPAPWPAEIEERAHDLSPWRDAQSEADEQSQVARIRDYIRAGDCYQVNLTTRLMAEAGPAFELSDYFFALHAAQPGGFSLMLRLSDEPQAPGEEGGETQRGHADEHHLPDADRPARARAVASVSPELFFDWRPLPEEPTAVHTWLLSAQPMKGTAPRGRDRADDEAAQAYLRTSPKERAENLMIVDLLRNDLSRVAVTGSVRVPRLFELHALPTVWQMTSTISAVSRTGLGLDELMAALFPCGSVTGAPKRRAMQVIDELEPAERGWYCGALGVMQPGGVATFNVPIRTVTQRGAVLTCGVGSGITLDAEPQPEIDEWRAKSRFLSRAQAPIAALETLRLDDGRFAREDRHLSRLSRTVRHFGLHASLDAVRARLRSIAAAHPQGSWRVRLTVTRQGDISDEVRPLPVTEATALAPLWITLADRPVDTRGPDAEFFQHKTTRREVYQAFLDRKPADCFDVLLHNRDGELTEGCLTNLAVQLDGPDAPWLTPRAAAGLLPGVMREELLEQGRIRESRLLINDLRRAHALAIFNSVRGWREARLLHEEFHDHHTQPAPPDGAQAPRG